MWLQLSVTVFLSAFVLMSHGQEVERASLGRSSEPRDGRCQYTFTVAAPAEPAGCPPTADQMEGVLSRLGLLEALVSRLVGGQRGGGTSRTGSRGDGSDQSEKNQLQRDKEQLQRDKETLSGRVEQLLSRVEQLGVEAETMRQKPCPPDQVDHGSSGSMYQGPLKQTLSH